jgi:SAM-dependent methyltransferase
MREVTGSALRPGGLELTRRAVALTGLVPGELVLDMGCGLGATIGCLAGEHSLRVIGLDISSDMLAQARNAHPGLALVRASGLFLPLADDSLDAVFVECVLSLFARPGRALAQIRRALRPGGWLVVSDLYLRRPVAVDLRLDLPGCLGGALGREGIPGLAEEAGFAVEAWEDHLSYLRELAARLVWTQGSAEALWGGQAHREAVARVKLGYFLMTARRKV